MHPLRSPSTPDDVFSSLKIVQDVPESDNYRHPPDATADESYQESWALVWYDPVSRVAGFHHFGLQHVRGKADLWETLLYEGKPVYHNHRLSLDLPKTDYDDMRIGDLRVVCEKPLRRHHVTTGNATGRCDVMYDAFFDPCRWDMDVAGAASGKGHYENGGRVRGTLTLPDKTITVNGYGYHDHSWGRRDWGKIVSFRNFFANFGPDFCVFVQDLVSDAAGRTSMGYIYKDGVFHTLSRVDAVTGIADDGHSPTTYDAYLWTETGHGGLHLYGEAQAFNVAGHRGYFQSNGHMVFKCGDRLGVGYTVVRELGQAASWHRKYLNLEE